MRSGRDRAQHVVVVRATEVVPAVQADATVSPAGPRHDLHRGRGVRDVRHLGQELDRRGEPVLGRAVADAGERLGRIVERAGVGPDDLDVVTRAQRVAHGEHRPLGLQVGGPIGSGCRPAAQRLDLHERHPVMVEHRPQVGVPRALGAQPLVLADVQAHRGEPGLGGGPHPLLERPGTTETEMAEDQVVRPQVGVPGQRRERVRGGGAHALFPACLWGAHAAPTALTGPPRPACRCDPPRGPGRAGSPTGRARPGRRFPATRSSGRRRRPGCGR